MADYYHLNEVDRFTLLIAAWFHDVAYREGAAGHEQRGAATAAALLKDEGIETPIIDAVSACILATRLPQHPTNLLEQIICDADLFHLGMDDFEKRNKLLHLELEALTHKKLKKQKWWQDSLRLLEEHHYFTDFCQQILQPKKIENMAHLRKKIENRRERKASLE